MIITMLPDDIILAQHTTEDIQLIGSFDELSVRETVRHWESRWETIFIPFDNKEYCLAVSGMYVYPFPQRSNSVDSEARYLAERTRDHEKWLLQLLEPHTKTSCHDHSVEIETFYSLVGQAMLRIPGLDLMLRNHEHYRIPMLVPHEIHTGPSAALTLIHITNINGTHTHNPRPRIQR